MNKLYLAVEIGTWLMFFVSALYLAYVLSCVWI